MFGSNIFFSVGSEDDVKEASLNQLIHYLNAVPKKEIQTVMLRPTLDGEVVFFSFAALYCSRLEFNALLASPRYEGLQ